MLKLNTDGSSRGKPMDFGLLWCSRGNPGEAIGFWASLKTQRLYKPRSGAMGIFRGVELVLNQGMELMEVESDSTFAVLLITEDPRIDQEHNTYHPYSHSPPRGGYEWSGFREV